MKRFASMALGALASLTLSGVARADLRTSYAQVASITPTVSMRDLAVNKNPGSPYYGYVYVTNVTNSQIKILRPVPATDGAGATVLQDTGLTITSPKPSATSTFGVSVGSDDTVWIANYGSGYIETAPPVPSGTSDVTSVEQFRIETSNPRSLYVTGSITDARVYVIANDITAQLYTGGATTPSTVGTFTRQWTTALGAGAVSYGVTADSAGNSYYAISANTSGAQNLIRKILPNGTVDESFAALRPSYTTILNSLADVDIVEDASAPGGGSLYWSGRQQTATVNKRLTHRFRLDNGAWLDSFGPDAATGFTPPTNGTYTVLDTNNAASPYYFATDDMGNLYLNSDNQVTVRKIATRAPFVAASGMATSAGAPVKSSPTAVDGVVYFGADDGKLYAYTTADGNPVAGFPVDISAAVAGVSGALQIKSRPAVHIIDTGSGFEKFIYITTTRGDVVKLKADGTGQVSNAPGNSGALVDNTTPAVTPDGTVYASLVTANGLQVVKWDADMQNPMLSPVLGPTSGTISSPAVLDGRIYVGLTGGTTGDIVVLSSASLTPLSGAGIAMGEGVTAPPYVNGIDMYVGTLAGRFYKLNSATSAPDPVFGGGAGFAAVGEPLPNSPFPDSNSALSTFFVGSAAGKVWSINAATGLFGPEPFYNTGDPAASVSGLVINREKNLLAFGTSAGKFYEVPLLTPGLARVFPGYGALTTTPTVDRSTGRYLVGGDDSNVYTFGTR